MDTTLAARFWGWDGVPIEVNGKGTVPIYKRIFPASTIIRVRTISSSAKPRQGLNIKTDKPVLDIAGGRYKDIVLWADATVSESVIHLSGRIDREIKFWNCWMNGHFIDAWQGNYGMQVEEIESGVRMTCSDGFGEPDFGNLIVDVSFEVPEVDLKPKPAKKAK